MEYPESSNDHIVIPIMLEVCERFIIHMKNNGSDKAIPVSTPKRKFIFIWVYLIFVSF